MESQKFSLFYSLYQHQQATVTSSCSIQKHKLAKGFLKLIFRFRQKNKATEKSFFLPKPKRKRKNLISAENEKYNEK